MSRLGKVGNRFQLRLQTVEGLAFYGQILDIPDTSRVSNFLSARRYLRTGVNSPIGPRDVIVANHIRYIVAEHGDGFFKVPIYRHFKLFEVDRTAKWYHKEQSSDNITGLVSDEHVEQDEILYLSMQPKTMVEDTLDIQQQTFTAIVNREIDRGDLIDNMVVTRVDRVLGVYLVELREK